MTLSGKGCFRSGLMKICFPTRPIKQSSGYCGVKDNASGGLPRVLQEIRTSDSEPRMFRSGTLTPNRFASKRNVRLA